MGFSIKKIFKQEDTENVDETNEEAYYEESKGKALESAGANGNKVILLEPRAYSESQQIADYLKKRNSVVVNLKRVTSDQAKRIVDFLSGTIYALGGDLQKIGGGIFLCTPNNVNIQGKISEDKDGKDVHDNDDIKIEF